MENNLQTSLVYLKDSIGNKYLGLNIQFNDIEEILEKWKDSFKDFEKYESMVRNKFNRDNNHYHITIVNVMEYRKLIDISENIDIINRLMGCVCEIEMLGVGKAIDEKKDNEANFIIVDSEDLDYIRYKLGLNPFHFHITIGFDKKDVFGKSKSIDSMFIDI